MDKRRCHRYSVELPVSFKAAPHQFHTSVGTTLNLSGKGLSLNTKEKLVEGQRFNIQARLPSHERVLLEVEVIWVEEVFVFARREYTVGLKIVDRQSLDHSKFVKFCAQVMLTTRQDTE